MYDEDEDSDETCGCREPGCELCEQSCVECGKHDPGTDCEGGCCRPLCSNCNVGSIMAPRCSDCADGDETDGADADSERARFTAPGGGDLKNWLFS